MTWDRGRERYASKMRARGTPLMVTQAEFDAAVRLLAKARKYGMSDRMIADQTGVHNTLPSKMRRGAVLTIHRDSYERLMSLRPARPATFVSEVGGKIGSGPHVDSTGTIRRIQALRADGFPGRVLGDRLGVSYEAVAQLAKTKRTTALETTRIAVAKLYVDLDGYRPEDLGVPSNIAGKCSTYARRSGYAPRSCWDPDTIDDPAAFPEWTGRCGTAFGRLIHKRDATAVCKPCEQAPGELVFSHDRFRAIRARSGLSQWRLEQVAGLSKGQVHHWEGGRYAPRLGVLTKVLAVFDATFEDVYDLEGVYP